MSILSAVKRKMAQARESRQYLDLVEEKQKPLRREAYLKQAMAEAVKEGAAMAKAASERKIQKEKRTEQDFGFNPVSKPVVMEDPMKFLDHKNPKPTKSKGKKK